MQALERRPRPLAAVIATFLALTLALVIAFVLPQPSVAVSQQGSADREALVSVIVQEDPTVECASEEFVVRHGGTISRFIGVVDGYAALVPEGLTEAVRDLPGVRAITPDAEVRLSGSPSTLGSWEEAPGWKSGGSYTTMGAITKLIGAQDLWARGITGEGIGVALIDSGLVPVKGLETQVVDGPDLSFESQAPQLRGLDTFGHGTHLAGIIAGRDPDVDLKRFFSPDTFAGVAPGATVISLKVAAHDGATDVSQVLAAIDWVVQHRDEPGLDIRVLNLSFGTDSLQDYRVDPLAYAAEVAWRKGIVVVVAAGNDGDSGRLNDPAIDPFVIAVGAEDMNGTPGSGDDIVPAWSSIGSEERGPDLVAPGRSVLSLRNPGSWADLTYPEARVGERFFRGTGTSQATAVVAGAVALLLEQRPQLTPDQVKALLTTTAQRLPKSDGHSQGSGLIDVKKASQARVPRAAAQSFPRSDGTGSLEAARGTSHVADNGIEINGEVDIFGQVWDGRSWSGRSWSGTSWLDDTWMGRSWSGIWEGESWAGISWSGRSWSDAYWDGRSWSGRSWSGRSWSGRSWSGRSWSGIWSQ